jgi:hypothetical protein
VKVVVLADRGFIHTDAMTVMTAQLGWHYRIRLKRDSWIWRVGHGWCPLKEIHLQRGEARCWHTVKLHKKEWYGPVHVALGYNKVNGEFWAIVSDEPTSSAYLPGIRSTIRYRSFSATGQRRWVDPHWLRGHSYFRIGWDWVN